MLVKVSWDRIWRVIQPRPVEAGNMTANRSVMVLINNMIINKNTNVTGLHYSPCSVQNVVNQPEKQANMVNKILTGTSVHVSD